MTRTPKDPQLINWSEISRQLTGNRNNLKTGKLPKKFVEPFSELDHFIENWIQKNKTI